MKKPEWWPKNPYPESVFPMATERYLEIVPDPELRTALSGMLGRQFWDIASEAIWEKMCQVMLDIPDEIVEIACAAYWDVGPPDRYQWSQLVKRDDHRLPRWRLAMKVALSAAVAAGLATGER